MRHIYDDVSNLNAPYDNYALQGVGGGVFGLGANDVLDLPWRTYSEQTLRLQKETNAELINLGYAPIAEDGKLGGRTCGAIKFTGGGEDRIPACLDHKGEYIAPTLASAAPARTTPAPATVPATLPVRTASLGGPGIPGWVWGLLAGGAAIGAVIYWKKTKK